MKRIVFITGADRGLGYGLAKGFLNNGSIVIAGRHNNDLTNLEELKKTYDENLFLVDLDISNMNSVKEAASFFEKKFGHLDILINNGAVLGNTVKTIFDEIDYEDIINTYNVNTLGPLRMTNMFIPYILKSNEKIIVNISSEAGSIGICKRKNWFAYSMSKSALNMQSTLLHNQLNEYGIKILIFHPGWLRTNMTSQFPRTAPTLPEDAAERIISKIENINNYYIADKPAYIDNDSGEILPW